MSVRNPRCLAALLWRNLATGWPLRPTLISGHTYTDEEVHEGCYVVVSRCMECGQRTVSWGKGQAPAHLKTNKPKSNGVYQLGAMSPRTTKERNMETETIIVTRHAGLVEYLREQGIASADAPVIDHATPELVRGKRVVGVLPLHLAVHAAEVVEVPMNIPASLRGQELTAKETAQHAAPPVSYTVQHALDVAAIETRERQRGIREWLVVRPDPCASIGCGLDDVLREGIASVGEALHVAIWLSREHGEASVCGRKEGEEAWGLPSCGAVNGRVGTYGFTPTVTMEAGR